MNKKEVKKIYFVEYPDMKYSGYFPTFEMGSAEFSIEGKKKKKKDFEKYGLVFNDYKTIQEEYELLDWMIDAVEKQKYQYYNL